MRRIVTCLFLVLCASMPMAAQDPVPYAGYRSLETERFTIIHEPHDEWAALRIASFAEEVLDELSPLLQHEPKGKIPVIISSRPAHANGYYSPFPPKIMLYITASESRFMGSRTADWLRSVFTHELTHYIHLTAPVGPARFLTPLFGHDVPGMNSLLMPGWWIEGITTYAESNFTAGGRGDSPRFALTYEAPLAEGNIWSLAQGSYASQYPPSGRIYSTGYLMVDHLMEQYGPDAFAEINRKFANWPFFGMSGPFRRTVGKSAKDIFRDALLEAHIPAIPRSTGDTPFSPQVTGDFHLPHPVSGGLVGFARTLDEGGSLVRYGTAHESDRILTRLPVYGAHAVTVTADGATAYIAHLWTDPYQWASTPMAPVGYSDLYRYDIASQRFSRLTERARFTHPAVSPDGSMLVATESVGDRYRLVKIDPTSGKSTILHEVDDGSLYEPCFSSGGESIVAIEVVAGRSTLVVVGMDGTVRYLWPHAEAELHNPRFVDADTIWFSSDLDGRLALFRHEVKTGITESILSDPIGILGAVPFGDSIVYATYGSLGHTLRTVPADALQPRPVTFLPADGNETPAIERVQNLASTRYRDHLRFNLWLPIPLHTDVLAGPGASIFMSSNLGRHVLGASAGWDIQERKPFGLATYRFSPGAFSFGLDAEVISRSTSGAQQSLFASVSAPLWQSFTIEASRMISLGSSFGATFRETQTITTTFGYIGYGYAAPSSPKDYFGRTYLSAVGSLQYDHSMEDGKDLFVPILRLTGQVPLGTTHHALVLEAAVARYRGRILTAELLGMQAKFGDIKSLVTLRYQMPLGLFDLPVPYGGLTALGLSLHAQSAFYLDMDGSYLDWEEDVYVGAKLIGDLAFGAAFTLKPSVAAAVSLATGKLQVYVGMGIDTLFSTLHVPAEPVSPHD